ncbi:MAG: TerY-C metal binding domain-containing protein [Desulfuromonadaceae bacterium]
MRRLPVFFVLDCSESMAGENLKKMEDGIGMIVRDLRQDPNALETAYLSIIAFAGIARTIAPMVEVFAFYPPKLPIGSGTSLGAALNELMHQIDSQVVKTTPEQKGDWKPIIYLFTDGKPTDKVDPALRAWQERYASKANLIAIAMGKYADIATLQKLTNTVLIFEDQSEGDFKKFISWLSASVSSQSKSVNEGVDDAVNLSRIDSNVISLMKKGDTPPPPPSDQDCVVLTGRCQKSKKPYIMKYDRLRHILPFNEERRGENHFELTGCYPITEEYFEWSMPESQALKVNSDELVGSPGCPYCGNFTAFAMCRCGKLMCINNPGPATCPWCGNQCDFSGGGDGGGFDVQRGRG